MALKDEIEQLGLNLDVASQEELKAQPTLVLLFGRSVRAQDEQESSGDGEIAKSPIS